MKVTEESLVWELSLFWLDFVARLIFFFDFVHACLYWVFEKLVDIPNEFFFVKLILGVLQIHNSKVIDFNCKIGVSGFV